MLRAGGVLAACAGRLVAVDGLDPTMWLLLAALAGIAAGGVYQQRFCAGVDFRVTATLQNAACVVPVVLLASSSPWTATSPVKAAVSVAAVVLLNATLCMTMYVRAINLYGAAAVSMLFYVIPAVAGLLAWVLLGQRPDVGIGVGLALGAMPVGSTRGRHASSVSTIQPATADGSIASMRSISPRGRAAACPCP